MYSGTSKLLGASVLVAVMAVGGCSSSSKGTSTGTSNTPGKKTASVTSITVGSPSGANGFDPYNCGYGPEQNILLAGYDTLIRAAPDGTFAPSLALSWKYTSPTVFTMTLRTGVTFADGTPMNAEAVAVNLNRAAKTFAQITAPLALAMQSVAVVGPTQLTITLRVPNPDLTTILSTCAGMIVSPKLITTPTKMATSMDGTGPYDYDSGASIAGSSYTFHKKATYWDTAKFPFKTVVFKVITDFNTAFNAIRSGQLDIAVGTPAEIPSAKSSGLASVQGNINFYAIDLRDREGTLVPALKDVRVRQALNYAIDRDAIIKTFFEDLGRPTDQLLNTHAGGYDADVDNTYPYNEQKAKDLLKAAGYANGFTLPVLSTQGFQLDQIVQAISGYWSKIGVKVQDDVQPVSSWATQLIQNKYPAIIFPFSGLPGYTALNQPFGPSSPLNPFHSMDTALDAALTTAASASSEVTSAAAVKSAQKAVLDQAWYAGVGYDDVIWFNNPKKVTGLQMQLNQSVPHFYNWQPGS
jgi:peptide/nickel transport system substrate-binding protein